MQVKLNHWPPFISHFFCIILGFGSANLSASKPVELNLPVNKIIFTLAAKRIRHLKSPSLLKGTQIYLAGSAQDGEAAGLRVFEKPRRHEVDRGIES